MKLVQRVQNEVLLKGTCQINDQSTEAKTTNSTPEAETININGL